MDLFNSFASGLFYPPINELQEQCGKFQLLDRLLSLLLEEKHKVLLLILNNKLNSDYPSVVEEIMCTQNQSVNIKNQKETTKY